jgi:hypothetical protein
VPGVIGIDIKRGLANDKGIELFIHAGSLYSGLSITITDCLSIQGNFYRLPLKKFLPILYKREIGG